MILDDFEKKKNQEKDFLFQQLDWFDSKIILEIFVSFYFIFYFNKKKMEKNTKEEEIEELNKNIEELDNRSNISKILKLDYKKFDPLFSKWEKFSLLTGSTIFSMGIILATIEGFFFFDKIEKLISF